MESEDGQGLRDCARREDNVCSSQHAEEKARFKGRLRCETMQMTRLFPKRAIVLEMKKGMEIHMCWSSRPGMPSKRKTVWLTPSV